MRFKLILLSFIVLCSCTKQIDYLPYFNSLQSSVTALQKSRDSLVNVINSNNASLSAIQKSRDSLSNALLQTNATLSNLMNSNATILKSLDTIKNQLVGINTQINNLVTQLNGANANILLISNQISNLNQQYLDLLAKYNSIIAQLNEAPASLSINLVAYYPFTGNAADSSGSGNHGVINGNVSITSDRFGIPKSAYMFNGGNIVIPHRQYLNINQAGEFSFSIWVNKTENQNPVHILGKRSNGAQQFNWQFGQHIKPAGAVGGGLVFTGVIGSNATGIDYNGITDATLTMNNWDHIVGVYNNGKWTLYKNGIIIAQKTSTLFYTDALNPSLEIGNSGGLGAFYGKIDDLRIYNRPLTYAEISYLYNH